MYIRSLIGQTDVWEMFDNGDLSCRSYNILKRTRLDYIETLVSLRANLGEKEFVRFLTKLPTLGNVSAKNICESLDKWTKQKGVKAS